MAKLNLLTGPRAGETLDIDQEQTIGRGEVDVVIEDPKLSRRHAMVRPAEGGVEVEDLGSLNGTFVDGERISQPTLVRGGEQIKLGDTTIKVERVIAGEPTVFATPPVAGATTVEPVAEQLAPPPPAAPAPPPAAPVSPLATEPAPPAPAPPPRQPAAAFGDQPVRAAAAAGYRPAATLLWGPTVLCLVIVIAVAVAEVVYFAAR